MKFPEAKSSKLLVICLGTGGMSFLPTVKPSLFGVVFSSTKHHVNHVSMGKNGGGFLGNVVHCSIVVIL